MIVYFTIQFIENMFPISNDCFETFAPIAGALREEDKTKKATVSINSVRY